MPHGPHHRTASAVFGSLCSSALSMRCLLSAVIFKLRTVYVKYQSLISIMVIIFYDMCAETSYGAAKAELIRLLIEGLEQAIAFARHRAQKRRVQVDNFRKLVTTSLHGDDVEGMLRQIPEDVGQEKRKWEHACSRFRLAVRLLQDGRAADKPDVRYVASCYLTHPNNALPPPPPSLTKRASHAFVGRRGECFLARRHVTNAALVGAMRLSRSRLVLDGTSSRTSNERLAHNECLAQCCCCC